MTNKWKVPPANFEGEEKRFYASKNFRRRAEVASFPFCNPKLQGGSHFKLTCYSLLINFKVSFFKKQYF